MSQAPQFLASVDALRAHVIPILSHLSTARPTAVNLSAATRRLVETLDRSISDGKDPIAVVNDLIAEGHLISDEDVGRNKQMSRWGAEWLIKRLASEGKETNAINILTVCNTGSLATSVGHCGLINFYLAQSLLGLWDGFRIYYIFARDTKIGQSLLYSNSSISSGIKVNIILDVSDLTNVFQTNSLGTYNPQNTFHHDLRHNGWFVVPALSYTCCWYVERRSCWC